MKLLSRSLSFEKLGNAMRVFVAFVIVVGALAWSWHIDLPVSTGEHTQVSATDHAHLDDGDLVDRCDHCCHAAAHLVALVSKLGFNLSDTNSSFVPAADARPLRAQTDPPYIPPIA